MNFTLITGMHRSGTSMLAQLLARSGVHLGHPHELLQSQPEDNPDGYWENIAGLQLNEEILQRLGGSWRAVPALPQGWETRPEFELFPHRMHGVFPPNAAQPQAFKDPRTTLTLRLWQRAYPQARLVVCLRNPIEVAYSLGSGLNQFRDLTFQEAFTLWQTYYEILLRTIQPADALWVHYESLLLDPHAALSRILNHIGVTRTSAEIQSAVTIVKTGHRHHAIPNDLVHGDYPSAAVAQYYNYLATFCGDDWRAYLSDPQRQYPIARAYLQTTVPTVLRQHEQKSAHLEATLAREQAALHQALVQQATLRQQVRQLETELEARLESAIKSTTAEVAARLHRQLTEHIQARSKLEILYRDSLTANVALHADYEVALASVNQRYVPLAAELNQIKATRSWRLIQTWYQFRHRLFPIGSWQLKLYYITRGTLITLMRAGPIAALQRLGRWLSGTDPIPADPLPSSPT